MCQDIRGRIFWNIILNELSNRNFRVNFPNLIEELSNPIYSISNNTSNID